MRRLLLAATAVLTLAVAAHPVGSALRAQEADLAPELRIDAWIHGDGRDTLADYRGDVVLLEFWQTH